MILIAFAILVIWSVPAHSYQLDVRLTTQEGMMFPIGRLLPSGGFNDANDVSFSALRPIFEMEIKDDNNKPAGEMARIFVRMEIITGNDRYTVFTVSSKPADMSTLLNRWMDNIQLANHPTLAMGDHGEVQPRRVLSMVDGQFLREGMYAISVAIVPANASLVEWPEGGRPFKDYGMKSAVMKIRNPNQVSLLQPINGEIVATNPIFGWSFPRAGGVAFNLKLVSAPDGANPSTALDFATDETIFMDTTFTLMPGASGETTTLNYTGTGNQRPLERNLTYYWRIIAKVPVMMGGYPIEIESPAYAFSYGDPIVDIITIKEPYDGEIFSTNPVIQWDFPTLPELEFKINVYKDGYEIGEQFSTVSKIPDPFESSTRRHAYGSGVNDRKLEPGNYFFRVYAKFIISGQNRTAESEIVRFVYQAKPVKLALVSPSNGERIDNAWPSFSWSFPPTVPVRKWLFTIQEGQNVIVTQELEGYVREFKTPRLIPPGGKYRWGVSAVLEGEGDSTIDGGWSKFEYPVPHVLLTGPTNSEIIYTNKPSFTWEFPTMPDDANLQFPISISTKQEGVITGTTVKVGRSWTFPGTPELQPDIPYIWHVRATFKLGDNEYDVPSREYMFTIKSDDAIDSAAIAKSFKWEEPQNNAVVDKAPTFRWSFLQLPEKYDPQFELTVKKKSDTPEAVGEKFLAKGNAHEVAHVAQQKVGNLALQDTLSYTVGIKADSLIADKYSGQDRKVTFTLPDLTFTYEKPQSKAPVDQDILRLIAAFHASMPEELAAALEAALGRPGAKISGIKVEGKLVSFEELMDKITKGQMKIVLVNPGKGGSN